MLEVSVIKEFDGFSVDLSFEQRGGVLILFGPSGAGKTTTLRMLCGIETPTRGRIVLNGRTLYSHNDRCDVAVRRRSIGMIFQHHHLFPHMTAHANIRYASRNDGDVDRWIERFGLGSVLDRYPRDLSGGERQRVAVVRTLVTRPELILFDEPLSSVDAASRIDLLDELRKLHRESGIPFIYVTHNTTDAFRLGDRVLVMDRGRVVQDGVPIEVFQTPTTLPTAALVGNENVLRGTVLARHESDGTAEVRVGDTVFHTPLCRQRQGEAAVLAIRPEDILVALQELGDTSARNQFRGCVTAVENTGTYTAAHPCVVVDIGGGVMLRARITRKSLESLGLVAGHEVYLLIKAWAIHHVERDASTGERLDR